MSIKAKKVLFVVNIPSPYRVDFFNVLGESVELTVAFEGTKASNRNPKWIGKMAETFNAIYLNGVRIRSEAFLSFKVISILKDDWDYIFLGGYSTPTLMLAIEYLRMKRKRFILEVDGGIISVDNRLKYRIKKHFISSANYWMSTGNMTTEYLTHYGANKTKCLVYPFSSVNKRDILFPNETDEYAYRVKREDLRIASKRKIGVNAQKLIISVGQIIYRKGYDILLKSLAQISRNVEVRIIGGIPTSDLSDYIMDNNLVNVKFVDFLKKDDLAEYYKAADVFVHPTREDIWGLVVNEALSYGLPVITTDKCIAGIELISNGYNGMIVPSDDSVALSKAIDAVLFNNDYSLGYNSMITARKYTIESMAKAHIDYINEGLFDD